MAETALATIEREELQKLEIVIEHGLGTFVEVGLALMKIREGKLYRVGHATFEAYCRDRWKMERTYAHRMIEAATVSQNVAHGQQIAALTNERQARELSRLKEPEAQVAAWQQAVDTAPDGVVTAAHVKEVVRGILQQAQPEPPPLPIGTFPVLYADPPWEYSNSGFDQSAASHYPTMSTADICAMPVWNLCAPETVLFLWATSPLLDQALQVIDAWGFTYKASLVWDKGEAPGMGWFVKTQHEFLLIATREANTHPRIKPASVIRVSPTRHSAKPHEFYDIIESMYSGPYCELFARTTRDGWVSWGNEV